jgi:membrane protein DedA with SNARE-associated domain
MILTALVGLIQSILYDVVLFYLGKILSDSRQLRNYLGMKSLEEQETDFKWTSHWIEKIGRLLMIIAVISAIVSIITTITVLSRM